MVRMPCIASKSVLIFHIGMNPSPGRTAANEAAAMRTIQPIVTETKESEKREELLGEWAFSRNTESFTNASQSSFPPVNADRDSTTPNSPKSLYICSHNETSFRLPTSEEVAEFAGRWLAPRCVTISRQRRKDLYIFCGQATTCVRTTALSPESTWAGMTWTYHSSRPPAA